jgi:hypothetical protein
LGLFEFTEVNADLIANNKYGNDKNNNNSLDLNQSNEPNGNHDKHIRSVSSSASSYISYTSGTTATKNDSSRPSPLTVPKNAIKTDHHHILPKAQEFYQKEDHENKMKPKVVNNNDRSDSNTNKTHKSTTMTDQHSKSADVDQSGSEKSAKTMTPTIDQPKNQTTSFINLNDMKTFKTDYPDIDYRDGVKYKFISNETIGGKSDMSAFRFKCSNCYTCTVL